MSDVRLLTNKEAANILENVVLRSMNFNISRGDTKSTTKTLTMVSVLKAIDVLRKTPDIESEVI